jgi:hypothetical protein
MPTRILTILSIITFCSFLKNEPGQLKCHKAFTSDQLKADFLLLTTKLQDVHPDLYRVTPKRLIDKRTSDIQNSIKSRKTYLEFLKLIAPLFTDIGDIGTQWGHSPDYIKFRNENIPIFPLQIKVQDDRFYIRNNYSADESITPETEIIKINGETPADYLKKNYSLLPTDGKIKSIQQRWLETYFPQHHSNFWAQPDSFKLELKDIAGNIFTKNIRALLKKDIQAKRSSSNAFIPATQFYISDNIGVLSIPSFKDAKLETFVDSCFTVMQNQKVKSLILNLKCEGSGNLYFGAILYSYLKQSPSKYAEQIHIKGDSAFNYADLAISYESIKKLSESLTSVTPPKNNSFNGNLYVITDGWTINSKGFFCAKIQQRPNTFFVGEECGASTFGINEFPISLTLPNTGLQIYIPTVQIEVNKTKNHSSLTGVHVDYPFKDPDNDKVIKQTLELVVKQNK